MILILETMTCHAARASVPLWGLTNLWQVSPQAVRESTNCRFVLHGQGHHAVHHFPLEVPEGICREGLQAPHPRRADVPERSERLLTERGMPAKCKLDDDLMAHPRRLPLVLAIP